MSVTSRDSGGAPAPTGRAGGDRDPAIFGIRGLAALALLTVHVAMFSGLLGTKALGTPRPPSNFLGAFFVSGLPSFIGVFFVLPALYLYLPLARAIIAGRPRPPQGATMVRRLMRLLPAYYLMYLVVLVALNRDAIDGPWFVLRPLLLLQIYSPSPFAPHFINGMEVSWTVPSMVQWYLALPLIAWASHRFAARGATPVARARRLLLPVPVLIGIGVGWLFFVKGNGWDNRMVFWWPQGFAPTIGIGLGLAVLLALSQVSPGDTPRLLRVAAVRPGLFWVAAIAVYLVNCARPFSVIGMDAIYSTSGLFMTYLMVALFGLFASLPLVSPGAARTRVVDAVLTARPVVHLGRVSYGVYLWHFAVMHFYLQPGAVFSGAVRPIRELYGTAGFWELETVTLLGAVLLATLSHRLFEQPLAALVDAALARRRRPTPRPPALRRAPLLTTATVDVLTPPEAGAALAAAVTDRDAIQTNLVDLERHLDRHLLAAAELTGESARRWAAARADLAQLWTVYHAYSAVVDEAVRPFGGPGQPSGAELAQVSALLGQASVVVTGPPPPLSRRRITDDGRVELTVAAAVARMDELFRGVAEVVSAAEAVWETAGARLDRIDAALAHRAGVDGADPEPAVRQVDRLRTAVRTDPLARWRDGAVVTDDLDDLLDTLEHLVA
ncbi:acyltransferase [Micromonospora matsumotoense]|uniref:acyltransferase n=1 Tax=Micromonospora matsumotoense TaxID=121616 RepID=UPI0033F5C44A